MPPPFWIHCNMCNAQFSNDTKHFICSCNHVMCKECMKTTNGKKCPTCKTDVRIVDITKLPDKMRNYFQPNIQKLFEEPSKILEFQQLQLTDLAKKTHEFKTKHQQGLQILEKEKNEIIKMKKQADSYIHQRRLMQEKLKEAYMKNKMKKKHEIYRNPHNSTISSTGLSSAKGRSTTPSSTKENSDFFDQNSPFGQNFTLNTTDFFASHSKLNRNKQQKDLQHTQSDRSPFFA